MPQPRILHVIRFMGDMSWKIDALAQNALVEIFARTFVEIFARTIPLQGQFLFDGLFDGL